MSDFIRKLPSAICPTCKRQVTVLKRLDGFNREYGPLIYCGHSGRYFRRECDNQLEQVPDGTEIIQPQATTTKEPQP